MAASGQRIPIPGALNPLPWRLTEEAKEIVNKRVVEIIYPHYTPVCHVGNESFIERGGCWRTASKLIAFLVILVPVLRGFVLKFRQGLRSLVHGLRILEGQTFSVNEMDSLNLERGFKSLDKRLINRSRTLIIEGLCMIEGCCPVRLLVPAIHCLCHYGDGAAIHGILRLLWMISFGLCFERATVCYGTFSLMTKPMCISM